MPSDDLFARLWLPEELRAAVSGSAWVEAMLAFEGVLASSAAEAGLVPAEAAEQIAAACAEHSRFDVAELGLAGRGVGNPAAPLVKALTAAVGGEASGHVHRGATSQDVMDTACALVSRRAVVLIDDQLEAVARRCAGFAAEHRDTVMVGRTLGQQALPITFGLKAAGWLDAVIDARERLAAVPFAAQLGGAAGTLAALGDQGPQILSLLASGLGLEEPVLPWHTARGRIAELGAALALVAGTVEKIAGDVVGLAQTEVGEVAEDSAGGRGGSSTMPHKRNPVGSIRAIACARRVRGEVAILGAALPQQHERDPGAWQSEWEAVNGALAYTGAAAAALREAFRGLKVHPGRMRENLEATGGVIMAEAVVAALVRAGMGRHDANGLVAEAADRAGTEGSFRDELAADGQVTDLLSEAHIDAALEPAGYLGSAGAFVDRALARYEEGRV